MSLILISGIQRKKKLYFPHSVPWNQKTLCGWIASIIYTTAAADAYVVVNSLLLSFYIGANIYFYAFATHFKTICMDLNERPERMKSYVDRNDELKSILCNAIDFHNNVKE